MLGQGFGSCPGFHRQGDFFQGSQEGCSHGALPWDLVIASQRREICCSVDGLWKTVEDFVGEGWGELD